MWKLTTIPTVLLTLTCAFAAVPATAAPGSAEDEGCRYAEERTAAAVLRAQRSVARVNIAVLRVGSELREAGQELSALPPPAALKAPRELVEVTATPSLEEAAAHAWVMKRYAVKMGALAEREMERLERPNPPPSGLGPNIDDEEEEQWRPTGEKRDSCLAWALYTERAAFRAEQAAQLAEVAADQAIAFSDHELRKVAN